MTTFKEYMSTALYHPEHGYYTARRKVLEDFYTAPELHPAFGKVLAADIAARLRRLKLSGAPAPYSIVEMGSGSGALAEVVLKELQAAHPEWLSEIHCFLVEKSPRFLEESLSRLEGFKSLLTGYGDISQVPASAGIFLSNELLDAFPVHLIEKKGGSLYEVYTEGLGMLSTPEVKVCAQALAPYIEEGQRCALNLDAVEWLRTVSRKLTKGWLITIDFGKRFLGGAAQPPKYFYRHTLSDSPRFPGREDITCAVDFEKLITEGEGLGLKLESYSPLGKFLLERGILDMLPEGQDPAAYGERNKIKTLFHPDGMGESFKVLIQSRLYA